MDKIEFKTNYGEMVNSVKSVLGSEDKTSETHIAKVLIVNAIAIRNMCKELEAIIEAIDDGNNASCKSVRRTYDALEDNYIEYIEKLKKINRGDYVKILNTAIMAIEDGDIIFSDGIVADMIVSYIDYLYYDKGDRPKDPFVNFKLWMNKSNSNNTDRQDAYIAFIDWCNNRPMELYEYSEERFIGMQYKHTYDNRDNITNLIKDLYYRNNIDKDLFENTCRNINIDSTNLDTFIESVINDVEGRKSQQKRYISNI